MDTFSGFCAFEFIIPCQWTYCLTATIAIAIQRNSVIYLLVSKHNCCHSEFKPAAAEPQQLSYSKNECYHEENLAFFASNMAFLNTPPRYLAPASLAS